jgi:hypothetical protein
MPTPNFSRNENMPVVCNALALGYVPTEVSQLSPIIADAAAQAQSEVTVAISSAAVATAGLGICAAVNFWALPMLIPVGAIAGTLIQAYNAHNLAIRRTEERAFVEEHPVILEWVDQLTDEYTGNWDLISDRYKATFDAWRHGELRDFSQYNLAQTKRPDMVIEATQETDAASLIPTVLEPLPSYPSSTADMVDYARAQAVALASSVTVAQTVIESFAPVESELDVSAMLANELYSYAIMSPSGGGKGMLVSNALRLIKQANPSIHIFLVDPKDDPKERGYWTGVVDTWARCNFLDMGSDAKTEFIEGVMARYQAVQGPKMLVFDEGTNIFGHLKNCAKQLFADLKSFLSGIASSGNSRKNYVWLIGHSGNLGDYGISGGEMSCFRKIYIAPMTNIEAVKQLGNTTFAGGKFGDEGVEFIKMIASQSEVSRAVYIGTIDNWKPMSRLVNHSGYNRDSDSIESVCTQTTNAEPSKASVEIVGKAMHKTLAEIALRQTGLYSTASLALAQMLVHLKAGKSREAIAIMMPHTHPSKTAFIAEFGEAYAFIYDWAVPAMQVAS